jgi:aryl-alcohol dehydrogenase-like predicted oxidoreductase
MLRWDGPARPREIIAAASTNGVGVMGIRAVAAGSLTSGLDRTLPPDGPEARDFERAAKFRDVSTELGVSPAFLAHQYALSMPGVSTVVLGVKNREELRECLAAEAAGPLDTEMFDRLTACGA